MSTCNSPKANTNLLQRSEVVALINTLHRLMESLHMVQDFRRMWAETGAEEEANLVSESASARKVCPCMPLFLTFCTEPNAGATLARS